MRFGLTAGGFLAQFVQILYATEKKYSTQCVLLKFTVSSTGPTGDIFAGTFLSQPYYSLAFLSALVLLIILVLIAIVVLCICNRCMGDMRLRM